MSYLVQDGIAFYEKESISQICRNHLFSIIIDESTDVSITQVLAVVRFFDKDKGDVSDTLLNTVEVEDATTKGLYRWLKSLLEEKISRLPIKLALEVTTAPQ